MYSDRQHTAIIKLKELAIHLGRIPFPEEFKKKHPQIPLAVLFGNYERAVVCAGILELFSKGPKKKNIVVFDSITDQIKNQKDKPVIQSSGGSTLVIGDSHFPFCAPIQLARVANFARILKPKNIVQMGDLHDFYALSKFPRSRNCYNPFEEVELAREMAGKFWAGVKKASPDSKCYQLLGNHDERPHKRILEACPDSEVFFSYKSCFQFDGVETIWDIRDELELDGRLYFHFRKNFGTNVPHFGKSCIFGHTHREQWKRFDFGRGSLFEFNIGLFGDPTYKELSYTPSKVTHWTLGGIALIDDFGPRSLVRAF